MKMFGKIKEEESMFETKEFNEREIAWAKLEYERAILRATSLDDIVEIYPRTRSLCIKGFPLLITMNEFITWYEKGDTIMAVAAKIKLDRLKNNKPEITKADWAKQRLERGTINEIY